MAEFRLSQLLMILALTLSIAESCSRPKPKKLKPRWVIVIDAGSTKTRINLYQFKMEKADSKWIPSRTDSEKMKPGLSSFKPDNPRKVSELHKGLQKLFQFAETIIESHDRKYTPVFLYATAGLRALPLKTSKKLLDIAKRVIVNSSFDHHLPECQMSRVQMISGDQEARFAWLSVNYFISSNINKETAKTDLGMLDMGGGSTQIAFRPNDFAVVKEAGINSSALWYPGDETSAEQQASGPGVYSKSFPGYGFDASTMRIVGAYDDCKPNCPADKTYESICLHADYDTDFSFGQHRFKLKGKAIPDDQRYDECVKIVKGIIHKSLKAAEKIKLLRKKDRSTFFGIAGFYYLTKYMLKNPAVEKNPNKLKSKRCKGYKITLDIIETAARAFCANPTANKENPYLPYYCMRISYVYVLFKDLYKFATDTEFHMCNKISITGTGEIKVGWPVGVAAQAGKMLLKFLPHNE